MDVVADILGRSISVGMRLRAPEDKKTAKARVNWILRQIKTDKTEDLYLRLLWPGASEPTQFLVSDLRENPDICAENKGSLVPHAFQLFLSKRIGARFTQQTNFIVDLENLVPEFYGNYGPFVRAWKKPAPTIKATEPEETLDKIEES